jgi:hypothetical protein
MNHNRLPDDVLKHLEETFKGKRISVEDSKGEIWIGECYFIGHNPYLPSWDLQVTLDRTPISNVKLSSIKIVELRKPLFKK